MELVEFLEECNIFTLALMITLSTAVCGLGYKAYHDYTEAEEEAETAPKVAEANHHFLNDHFINGMFTASSAGALAYICTMYGQSMM